MADDAPPVTLREITRATLGQILALDVAPDQRAMVATNAKSLAQAHFHPEAWYRAIYAGEVPVGFLMLEQRPEEQEYTLWRLMIDAGHQRKGYGTDALRLAIDHVRALPGATELLTSHVERPGNPGPFYESLGFVYTGDVDGDERIMRLLL